MYVFKNRVQRYEKYFTYANSCIHFSKVQIIFISEFLPTLQKSIISSNQLTNNTNLVVYYSLSKLYKYIDIQCIIVFLLKTNAKSSKNNA
jgi:hypothetical protein